MLLVEKPPVELPPVDNAENDGVLGKVDDLVDEVDVEILGDEAGAC